MSEAAKTPAGAAADVELSTASAPPAPPGPDSRVTRSWYRHPRAQTITVRVVSVLVLLGAWLLTSNVLSARVIPGPLDTFSTMWANFQSGVLLEHTSATLSRIGQGFALAMAMGTVVGLLMGLSRLLEKALDVWVMVAMVIPSLCYIIVVFLWLGMNERGTVVAVALTSFPFIAINIWEGVKSIDRRLNEMATTLGASRLKRVWRVTLPQVLPYLVASTRFGLGIVWKVVVIAELLGRSSGIGFQLFYWFQLFNMRQVFAWTLFFTLIMLLIEVGFMKPMERRLFRWRPDARA